MDDLLTIRTMSDLGRLLGVSTDVLKPYCFHKVPDAYRSFEIPKKKGGTREILRPNDELMMIQRNLANHLSELYKPHHSVHSFVPSRNVLTNALSHIGQDWVFRVDIRDFFPSIKLRAVIQALIRSGITNNVASMVSYLCTHQESLPQGAPTSPVLSNMVFHPCDVLIMQLCSKLDCVYTRYADDLTFSHCRSVAPTEIHRASETMTARVVPGDALVAILAKAGFTINFDKTRLSSKHEKQEVVGVVVNPLRLGVSSLRPDKRAKKRPDTGIGPVSLSRCKLRFIRSALHRLETQGYQQAEVWYGEKIIPNRGKRDETLLQKHLAGSLSYAVMINGLGHRTTRAYVQAYNRLLPEPVIQFESIDRYRSETVAGSGSALKFQNAVCQLESVSFKSYLADNKIVDFDEVSARDRERMLSAYCNALLERIDLPDMPRRAVLSFLGLLGKGLHVETVRDLAKYCQLKRMNNHQEAALVAIARATENELNRKFFDSIRGLFARDVSLNPNDYSKDFITTVNGVRASAHDVLHLGQYPYLAEAISEYPQCPLMAEARRVLENRLRINVDLLLAKVVALRTEHLLPDAKLKTRFILLRNKACHPEGRRQRNTHTIDNGVLEAAEKSLTGTEGLLTLFASVSENKK